MGKFDLWGGVFDKVKDVDEKIIIHNENVMDTLKTMTRQDWKDAPIRTDQKEIVTYLRNNYSQEEIANLFIQQPEVLEWVQSANKYSAELRGNLESWEKHGRLYPKDFENLLMPLPEDLTTWNKNFLERVQKGKLSDALNQLGFGRHDNRKDVKGKVTRTRKDLMGTSFEYIAPTGYFDPNEWGTHKKK
tara:strand:+ start:2073 stop:2639 length:567 start_codon:yes stop_codon:yes gene_type:complete